MMKGAKGPSLQGGKTQGSRCAAVFKRREHASRVLGFFNAFHDWDSVSGSQARNRIGYVPGTASPSPLGALDRFQSDTQTDW